MHKTPPYNNINTFPACTDKWQRFTQGDEKALSYVYGYLYASLHSHGKKIVNNDFVVDTAIQDAFLKCWSFRRRMESMMHIYRFLRLNIRWKCLDYYDNPRESFHRSLEDISKQYNHGYSDCEAEAKAAVTAAEKLQLIEAVIPYLNPSRQIMIQLYFSHGFSYKRIAARFAISHTAAYREVERSLEQLKQVIHAAKKINNAKAILPGSTVEISNDNTLTVTERICKLRTVYKLSFELIGSELKLGEEEVKKLYITACKNRK